MEILRQFLSSENSSIYDIHIHDLYEFYFVDTEHLDIIFEDVQISASCGDVYIFPPFTFHMIDSKGNPYKRHVSHFDEEYMMTHSPCSMPIIEYIAQFKPFYVRLDEEQCSTLRSMISKHTELVNTPSPFRYFNVVYSLCDIIKYVAELHMEKGVQPINFQKNTSHIFSKILKYIHMNYTDEISVDEIAKNFKISKSTLYNTFVKYSGISLKEYVTRLRIAKSMELLKKGISVTETSNLSGFSSYAHFIRVFSNRVGISPKQFALKKSSNQPDDYLKYLNS